MLIKALLVVVGLGAAFCGFVATRPSEFRVTRSAVIAAPAERTFEMVNDFKNWDAWSPWAKLDPNMKKTLDGAQSGAGAIYTWAGNDDVGEGRMTILESKPDSQIQIQLEFLKPWTATNNTTFEFTPEGGGTKVVWTMDGVNDFMGKAFSVFMNMDKMVGGDFEKGLAQMKAAAEARKAS